MIKSVTRILTLKKVHEQHWSVYCPVCQILLRAATTISNIIFFKSLICLVNSLQLKYIQFTIIYHKKSYFSTISATVTQSPKYYFSAGPKICIDFTVQDVFPVKHRPQATTRVYSMHSDSQNSTGIYTIHK